MIFLMDILHHFLLPAYSIMYPELVGFAHVQNNESDHPSVIIEYAPWCRVRVSTTLVAPSRKRSREPGYDCYTIDALNHFSMLCCVS